MQYPKEEGVLGKASFDSDHPGNSESSVHNIISSHHQNTRIEGSVSKGGGGGRNLWCLPEEGDRFVAISAAFCWYGSTSIPCEDSKITSKRGSLNLRQYCNLLAKCRRGLAYLGESMRISRYL